MKTNNRNPYRHQHLKNHLKANKHKKDRITIGLRDATPEDIARYTERYEKLGYTVTHRTENLPHNGVLVCEKKPH